MSPPGIPHCLFWVSFKNPPAFTLGKSPGISSGIMLDIPPEIHLGNPSKISPEILLVIHSGILLGFLHGFLSIFFFRLLL